MFEQFMGRYAAALDNTMRQVVGLLPENTPDFSIMVRYPLGWVDEHEQPYEQSTGKRIRPMFLLLCTEAAGGEWQKALPAAAAVELLHNFSLIHDDIQDDSPVRHGRPTVWKNWGIANAINAGDAMFSLAYCALEQLSTTGLPAETILKIWRVFNQTNLELTRGQHLDMRFERQDMVAVSEYVEMISGKSAALLSACAQIGALVAASSDEVAGEYAEFALNLGIAFQIRDDILGIWGDPDVTGKSVATDILSRNKSLPVLYGLERSDELASLYRHEHMSEADVAQAVALLDDLGAASYARETETHYYEKALEALEAANPQGRAGDGLRQFVEILFQRVY